MKFSLKAAVKLSLVLLLTAAVVVSAVFTGNAELENVYTKENPEMQLAHIYDKRAAEGWEPTGTLTDLGNGKYDLSSNSWCFWGPYDSLDFAYTQTNFNTGAGSILTVSVNLDSYNPSGAYSSTGIMIRESLSANSRGVFLFVRGTNIYLMYRQQTSETLPYTHFSTTIKYPLELKMVVNKDRKKVYGYITAAGGKQVPIGPISFDAANQLYVGFATHSQNKDIFDKSVYSNLKISLDAPEGWEYEEEENTGSEESGSSEPEIILPEDLPVSENTLLKETFTKGILLEDEDGSKETVTTPLWTVRSGTPNLQLNSAQTDRYLMISSLDDPLMITAGDMNWTDYKMSAQITFSSELTSLAETNEFLMLLRHRTLVIGGSGEYSVRLINKFSSNGDTMYGQYLQICYRVLSGKYIPSGLTVLKEIQLAEGAMLPYDTTHTITAEVFDDTITVYLNGEKKLTYPETEAEGDSRPDERNMHLFGNVGIYASNISAQVDNITVTKLNDVLGGDYDNKIAGRFDEPIPDYIQNGFLAEE